METGDGDGGISKYGLRIDLINTKTTRNTRKRLMFKNCDFGTPLHGIAPVGGQSPPWIL
jgi:hypothetical protein